MIVISTVCRKLPVWTFVFLDFRSFIMSQQDLYKVFFVHVTCGPIWLCMVLLVVIALIPDILKRCISDIKRTNTDMRRVCRYNMALFHKKNLKLRFFSNPSWTQFWPFKDLRKISIWIFYETKARSIPMSCASLCISDISMY